MFGSASWTALLHVQKGLRIRRWLRCQVDALLWAGGAACVALAFMLLSGVSALWIAGSALAAVLGVRLWRGRCRTITRVDAGLYLDQTFGLQERLSAVACLDRTRSVFAAALVADADRCLEAIRARPVLGDLWPARTPYLAVPVAVSAALLLLGQGFREAGRAGGPDPDGLPAVAPAREEMRSGMRLRELLAEIRAADERYRATGREEDRQAAEALRAKLYQEIERARREQAAREAAAREHPDDGARSAENGKEAGAVEVQVRTAEDGSAGPSGSGRETGSHTPAWEAWAQMDAEIPAACREGVRAYMNALAQGEQP